MREIETDYLVVGAGASGMAFVDTLLTLTDDAEVVLVDRRHRVGGHWLDAYPFVRLHQPSAYYGVASRPLGTDRLDETGPNAGFYERATAAEICDYFNRVLDEQFLPSGRVRFLPMTDYRGHGPDGHRVVSLLGGEPILIKARKLVDATYVESEIPSRHAPSYAVDDDVRLMPPNDLVHLGDAPSGFTVIGAGKTAMDTCCWLIDTGVDPDRITWIRSRDPWMWDRQFMQPLDLVGAYMEMQGHYLRVASEAEDGRDFARRLEAAGVFVRIDPKVEPQVSRGPTISQRELGQLRSVERVVRKGKVRAISTTHVTLDDGELQTTPGEVYVDCTAAGVRQVEGRPVFEPDRLTLGYVTIGVVPWGAAIVAAVEAMRDDDREKNRLCPPLPFNGNVADSLPGTYFGLLGAINRGMEPDIDKWNDECRLYPAKAAKSRRDDPQVAAGYASMIAHIGPAVENLQRRVAGGAPAPRDPGLQHTNVT